MEKGKQSCTFCQKLKWYILLARLGNPSGTSRRNAYENQVGHPVKTLRKLKWYILLKRLGNSSGTSCQHDETTQVVHLVKTLRKLKWYIRSKRLFKLYATFTLFSTRILRSSLWLGVVHKVKRAFKLDATFTLLYTTFTLFSPT